MESHTFPSAVYNQRGKTSQKGKFPRRFEFIPQPHSPVRACLCGFIAPFTHTLALKNLRTRFWKTRVFPYCHRLMKMLLFRCVSICLLTSPRCEKETWLSWRELPPFRFQCLSSFSDRQPVAFKRKKKKDIFRVSQQGTWCQMVYITKIPWSYFLFSFIWKK